jgi:hypothetical protein
MVGRMITRRSENEHRQGISLHFVCIVIQTATYLDDPAMTTRDGQN